LPISESSSDETEEIHEEVDFRRDVMHTEMSDQWLSKSSSQQVTSVVEQQRQRTTSGECEQRPTCSFVR